MTDYDKQLKSLYKKFSYLLYPDLIKRAMIIDREYNNRQRFNLRNSAYYKQKKFYLSIKKELQKDINDLRTVDKYMSIDYYNFDRSWIIQSKVHDMNNINEQLRYLDMQHRFNIKGEY